MDKEDCLEDLAKSDDFDIYALLTLMHELWYGCLQAKNKY